MLRVKAGFLPRRGVAETLSHGVKQPGQGKGAAETDPHSAHGDFDQRANLEESQADRPAGGFGPLGSFQSNLTQLVNQQVGQGGEP